MEKYQCYLVLTFLILPLIVSTSITQDKSELTHGERYANFQKCFQDRHAYSKLALVETNLEDVLRDDLKICFESLTLDKLFPESATMNSSYLEHFDNLTKTFCPDWTNSSRCFYEFLNQNCSHGDINDIIISPAAGKSILLTELVCNDEKEVREKVRNYIKDAVDQGLVECYKESKPLKRLFDSCKKFKCRKATLLPLLMPFDECIQSYFECIQSFFELCVQVDRLDDTRKLWASIELSLKAQHKLLYN